MALMENLKKFGFGESYEVFKINNHDAFLFIFMLVSFGKFLK
jgi:hypothetical protein